ncbi:contractile injection system protein, VgrG/Pvc8 family, partial [Pseudomonas paraeruginosa]
RDYERYDYPGRYKRDAAGVPFTRDRLRGLRGDARLASVEGDDARLVPGVAFDLQGHPREDWNRGWRPVWMKHRGTQYTSQAEESAEAERGSHYSYTAQLVPDRVEWRPAPRPRPVMAGPQVATVVGPEGEEFHVDEHGRVKVQFP